MSRKLDGADHEKDSGADSQSTWMYTLMNRGPDRRRTPSLPIKVILIVAPVVLIFLLYFRPIFVFEVINRTKGELWIVAEEAFQDNATMVNMGFGREVRVGPNSSVTTIFGQLRMCGPKEYSCRFSPYPLKLRFRLSGHEHAASISIPAMGSSFNPCSTVTVCKVDMEFRVDGSISQIASEASRSHNEMNDQFGQVLFRP